MKTSPLTRVLVALLSVVILGSSYALAAPRGFVIQKKSGAETNALRLSVKKPRIAKRYKMNSLEIRGCWISDGLKSIKVVSKQGKRLRFKVNSGSGALELRKVVSSAFPLKVVLTFSEKRPVTIRGSEFVAVATTQICESTGKGGKKSCTKSLPVETSSTFDGVACVNPADYEENGSPATIVLSDGDALTFRSPSDPLRFSMVGDTFLPDITDVTVLVNDEAFLAPEVTLENGILSLVHPLVDGLNEVEVIALDSQGRQAAGSYALWAGSNSLQVSVIDENNLPVDTAEITLALADNKSLAKTQTTSGGTTTFSNIPSATVVITATTTGGRTGFVATNGNGGSATIKLIPFNPPSTIQNNDISLGTDGWEIGNAPVSIVPHVEDEGALQSTQVAAPPTLLAGTPDQDLVLSTLGEGLQFISRTFKVSPGTRSIEVRYRFQTSEFPGGYFGTKFNDFFNISIRTLSGGGSISDGNNMNALGQGAFSPAGLTAWRTAKLPVNKDGDDVQVQMGVANVADGAYDSRITVDYIKESSFAITKAEVLDIDGTKLEFVSGDDHPYFDKFTHFFGTIRLEGDKDDSVKDLELQILDGTTVKASAKLSTTASSKILKKFGTSGVIELKNPILLFKLFPNDASGLNSDTNATYTLRIRATSTKGETSDFNGGSVGLLVRFKGLARYDGRDEAMGGDDWVKPTVRAFAEDHSLTYGDFSNMNGGQFPPHDTHLVGESIDAWFPGYNSRDAAAAQQIISLLGGTQGNPSSSTGGSRIRTVFVAFNRSPSSSFWNAIRGVTLRDGRKADRVIVPDAQHSTHFHLGVRP